MYDKKIYVVHIKALKLVLNYGLILEQMHRITPFDQKAWLKPYIDMTKELRRNTKNDLLISSSVILCLERLWKM